MAQDDLVLAQFTAMTESSKEDWTLISGHYRKFAARLPERVMSHLRLLDGDFGGFPIDRLQHSRQCATRAYRDGRSESYVVAALLHDIGDTLSTFDHPAIAAAMLKPFVSEELHWIVEHHGIFQGYYFYEHIGLDRDMRERYRDHPYFESCAEFCHLYDQSAFAASYDTAPLEFFNPMVERVMKTPLK